MSIKDEIADLKKRVTELVVKTATQRAFEELYERVEKLEKRFDEHLPKFKDIIGLYADTDKSEGGDREKTEV